MKLTRLIFTTMLSLLAAVAIAQQVAPSQRLMQEYATADNLRAFALQAKERPNEGGLFYARYVADLCGREFKAISKNGNAALSKQIQASGTVPSWQLAMIGDLPRRCAGFIDGEAAALVAEIKRIPTATDPLLRADQDLRAALRSGRRDVARSAMARVMEIDDPYLWTSQRLWEAVAQSDAEAKKASGLFLGGIIYAANDGIKHLEAHTALELGFCKPNAPCALDDELRIICAAGGACAPDREAKARDFYLANGGSEEGWLKVLALLGQVRAALAAKNVGFFIR